jgi:hypothetical protein
VPSKSAADCPGDQANEDDGVGESVRVPAPSAHSGCLERTQAAQGNALLDEHGDEKEGNAHISGGCGNDPSAQPITRAEPRRENSNGDRSLDTAGNTCLIDAQDGDEDPGSELHRCGEASGGSLPHRPLRPAPSGYETLARRRLPRMSRRTRPIPASLLHSCCKDSRGNSCPRAWLRRVSSCDAADSFGRDCRGILAARGPLRLPVSGLDPVLRPLGLSSVVRVVHRIKNLPLRWLVRGGVIIPLTAALAYLFNARENAARRAALPSAIARTVVYLAVMELLLVYFPMDLLGLTTAAAVAMDVAAELRLEMTEGKLVAVRRIQKADHADDLIKSLREAGIPAVGQAAFHRTLLQFFGPFIPVDILVPAARAAQAFAVLDRLPKLENSAAIVLQEAPEAVGYARGQLQERPDSRAVLVARLAGVEPAARGFEGRCSIQLSYRRVDPLCLAACPRVKPPCPAPAELRP